MVAIPDLWLPILLSAVAVFVLSSVIHMVLGYHAGDFSGVPDEDALQAALREQPLAPGEYIVPHAKNAAAAKSPEYQERMNRGTNAFLTVLPSGPPAMGGALIQWFVYSLVVGVFVAYLTGRVLAPGTHYLTVFRYAGTVAFAAYALGLWQNSIWFKRRWATTMRFTLDGLLYAIFTAGFFGWLWPS